jgi:plastocyanin
VRRLLPLLICVIAATGATASLENSVVVTGSVSVTTTAERANLANLAVWLTPMGDAPRPAESRAHLKMVQENKRFTPHMMVVRVGSVVDFPNLDPFFHNVFSMYDGKRFDLGLYEAGASKSVTFSKPGICYVFCNIHPEMSAVIVAVETPYYTVSTKTGEIRIADVPPGRYTLNVWHERYAPATAADAPRDVTISEANRSLGVIRLVDTGKVIAPHKNKYGQEYDPPGSPNPVYR